MGTGHVEVNVEKAKSAKKAKPVVVKKPPIMVTTEREMLELCEKYISAPDSRTQAIKRALAEASRKIKSAKLEVIPCMWFEVITGDKARLAEVKERNKSHKEKEKATLFLVA